ncbi:MAG: methyltransferase domain-containing protein [Planctomycetota bacterium]
MDRLLTPELMDDPEIDPAEHAGALAGLARLNRLSDAAGPVWGALLGVARGRRAAGARGPIRVLDIATGSGDVPVGVGKRAARAGLDVELHACDISGTALEAAAARARAAGLRLEAFEHDLLAADLPDGFDVVTCCLFLHHLDDDGTRTVLARMRRAARERVIVSDLTRCRSGLVMAFAASRVFTRSRVVHVDAVKSVRAAYTPGELGAIAREAGMVDASIARVWPRRMLLAWSPKQ